jgi:4-diphosphocytidyl-2-C-methyl-D-erythritol kinase
MHAPAKINITLEIVGSRDDGNHLIRSIMQSVDLYDEVAVTINNNQKIKIVCNDLEIPKDERNTAYIAAVEFFKYTEIEPVGLNIVIDKKIPTKAGLGGGSSDAAAVIHTLNDIFDAGLSIDQMCEIGEKVGADVPFCVVSGTALVEGIGEILTELPNIPDCYIVIVKPDESVSTALAFKEYDENVVDKIFDVDQAEIVVASIVAGDLENITSNVANDLLPIAKRLAPKVEYIIEEMQKCDPMCASMSGSGSACFAIFDKKRDAEKCGDFFEDQGYKNVFLCKPLEKRDF